MSEKPIYLDYNATTPLDREALDAMLPYLENHFGNPSSTHPYGREAHTAVDVAREQLAALLGCEPEEVVFTSGGTESNNTVVKGVAQQHRARGKHIITTSVEHPSVLDACEWLHKQGFSITILPVNDLGRVNVRDVERAIRKDTILISVMLANNEVGTLNRLPEISEVAHAYGVLMHTDAAQAVGKIPVDVRELDIDFLTIAAHKMYAPKGIGALYVRSGVIMPKLMHGASQENNHRAGTENVPYIVALGQAAAVAARDLPMYTEHMTIMRDRLADGLSSEVPEVCFNGDQVEGLPNTLSASFRNVEANKLLARICDQVAASPGAACHSGSVTVSPVIQAMGVPFEYAMGTIRLSVGKMTTEEEIDQAVDIIGSAVRELRAETG